MPRNVELTLSVALSVLLLPVVGLLGLMVFLADGGPVFYRGSRVGQFGRRFRIWKLRTMNAGPETGVTCATKGTHITGVGRVLRRFRLDELPQILNVISGQMALVGPRPAAPEHAGLLIAHSPAATSARPGVTGLATVSMFRFEARVLAAATSQSEAEAIYARRCLPRKARIDAIYRRNRTLGLDLWIIALTVLTVTGLVCEGRLPRRRLRATKGYKNAQISLDFRRV